MFLSTRFIRKPLRGFSLAEVLIAIVIITILTIGSIAVYTSQLAKARDTERVNDVSRIKTYLDTIVGQYGTPPGDKIKSSRGLGKKTGCNSLATLYTCFTTLKISSTEDLKNLFLDPTEGNQNTRSTSNAVYGYRYGADQNSYKICSMLEDQTSNNINATLVGADIPPGTGNGQDALFCLSETPVGAKAIATVTAQTDTAVLADER